MNKKFQQLICWVLAATCALLPLGSAQAQNSHATQACTEEQELMFGFFNGVQTAEDDARDALSQFRRLYGETTPNGDRIVYDLFYNHTTGFSDFVETFSQRLKEHENLLQGRYELFFEALKGGSTWWSRITSAIPAAQGILDAFKERNQALIGRLLVGLIQKMEALIPGHTAQQPPTGMDYAEHRSRIDNHILEGRKLLLVAHSQGNLFANMAYRYAVDQASADAVRLVHIAPASPTLNGSHTLVNLDLVINGLRLVGSVPPYTNHVVPHPLRPPGLNGKTDILGHGLLEIYLNPRLSHVSSRIKNHILAAMDALVAPPAQATPGLFTATLTWDGAGDVDLHTAEPGGGYVYYNQKRGDAGYLDVDNVHAKGPEHYFASCHPDDIREGIYTVSVANFARAKGRAATVQISSHRDGVLGTRTVVLGEATGDTPSHTMFKVQVKQNPKNGRYDVALVR